MCTLGWTRSLLLYATLIITAFATISCGEPPASDPIPVADANGEFPLPPPDGGIPQCEAYKTPMYMDIVSINSPVDSPMFKRLNDYALWQELGKKNADTLGFQGE